MNKTNIKCPRCHSDKLYKFGFNKQAKQKYQCKQCKRQFHLATVKDYLKEIILDVLNVVKEHTYITHINITIATNAITKSVIT